MPIFTTYVELLNRIEQFDCPIRALGHAPDGSPIVSVRTGGEKEPAIFITAGSHSTEHAGVSAAVELIGQLDTEHQVYVIPTRDPIGLNGYEYALSLQLGERREFHTFEEVEAILRESGEVFYDKDGMLLSLIGDYGFASSRPAAHRPHPQWGFYNKLQEIQKKQPKLLEPFKGRRIYMTPGQSGIEGTGNFGRAYTLIISLGGEVLHLNRFHDTIWAPIESRCARRLMAEIQPGITFDLHESQLMRNRYWLSARHQQDAQNEAWEKRIATATIKAIADFGGVLADDIDVLGVPIEQTWFTRSEKGVYWLDASVRGEGLNLVDYASRLYGLAFGTEMGMYGGFEERVSLGMLTVQMAVKEFEERYR
jgi:hypothetical protein